MDQPPAKRISIADLGNEPFRIFFPAGVLSGITGVLLWPLHFAGVTELYPGQAHARIMADGLFGGFIFGFLGTAMPRMLSAPSLGTRNVLLLICLHFAMLAAFAMQKFAFGDALFLALLLLFAVLMAQRARHRKDTPPPGFLLVGIAFLCAISGAVLALIQDRNPELDSYWVMLQRLLSYQGFVLLPILGIGPFILPRFFGLPGPHDFPERMIPSSAWLRKAALALAVGLLIIASFLIEVAGNYRLAHGLRFITTLGYLLLEFPFRRAPRINSAPGLALRIAFGMVALGFIGIALFPELRVGLLHLTLIGGFAVIAFVVATRVVFGHSGNLERLKERNRWLLVAVGLMLVAMATRISGDFWPQISASYYSYGALIWIAGVVLWSAYVLPKVLQVEKE